MGDFGKYVLKLKFSECSITKCCLPFSVVNPSFSPWQVVLGTGRCCDAGDGGAALSGGKEGSLH